MKFAFLKVGIPRTIKWEELRENILGAIEKERRENMPPSAPSIESGLLSIGDSTQTRANTTMFSNDGTAIDDLYPIEKSEKNPMRA